MPNNEKLTLLAKEPRMLSKSDGKYYWIYGIPTPHAKKVATFVLLIIFTIGATSIFGAEIKTGLEGLVEKCHTCTTTALMPPSGNDVNLGDCGRFIADINKAHVPSCEALGEWKWEYLNLYMKYMGSRMDINNTLKIAVAFIAVLIVTLYGVLIGLNKPLKIASKLEVSIRDGTLHIKFDGKEPRSPNIINALASTYLVIRKITPHSYLVTVGYGINEKKMMSIERAVLDLNSVKKLLKFIGYSHVKPESHEELIIPYILNKN